MLSSNQVRTIGLDGTQNKMLSGIRNITSFIKDLNARASNAGIGVQAQAREEAPSENTSFASTQFESTVESTSPLVAYLGQSGNNINFAVVASDDKVSQVTQPALALPSLENPGIVDAVPRQINDGCANHLDEDKPSSVQPSFSEKQERLQHTDCDLASSGVSPYVLQQTHRNSIFSRRLEDTTNMVLLKPARGKFQKKKMTLGSRTPQPFIANSLQAVHIIDATQNVFFDTSQTKTKE